MTIEPGQIYEVTRPLGLPNPNTKILILKEIWSSGFTRMYEIWLDGKTTVVTDAWLNRWCRLVD